MGLGCLSKPLDLICAFARDKSGQQSAMLCPLSICDFLLFLRRVARSPGSSGDFPGKGLFARGAAEMPENLAEMPGGKKAFADLPVTTSKLTHLLSPGSLFEFYSSFRSSIDGIRGRSTSCKRILKLPSNLTCTWSCRRESRPGMAMERLTST